MQLSVSVWNSEEVQDGFQRRGPYRGKAIGITAMDDGTGVNDPKRLPIDVKRVPEPVVSASSVGDENKGSTIQDFVNVSDGRGGRHMVFCIVLTTPSPVEILLVDRIGGVTNTEMVGV